MSALQTLNDKELTWDSAKYRLLQVYESMRSFKDEKQENVFVDKDVKHELIKHLDVKDLGSLKSFLGVLFGRDSDGGWLSQQHYITQVLHRFGMLNCKPVATPMCSGALKDIFQTESVPADRAVYQELIGGLLFIATRTCPDIAAAVSILCQFSCAPTETHWTCLKRILRYLRGTKGHALPLYTGNEQDLVAFCDADWAGDRVDRRSTTGIVLQFGKRTVAWKALKQSSVALSTTEAEFLALSEGTKLVLWLRCLFSEMDCTQKQSTTVNEDNQGQWFGQRKEFDMQSTSQSGRTSSGKTFKKGSSTFHAAKRTI